MDEGRVLEFWNGQFRVILVGLSLEKWKFWIWVRFGHMIWACSC